ncbi:tRNA 2-selenouridine(34) synthase MnmH [Cognatishimia sp. MH4019]|uniref:tRNA 2-selenouridine(34) synthase MnmH n=1 Tax=Cognatishimia sp. MH4019 TaxID=2854030 RepID=UPI001CD7CF55|nr:tRNA 2-selenouridine(34) synthase MnmH [Cognatishimia sp. MH4019]
MAVKLTSLNDLKTLAFDDIIDVRAPSEFAEDHVPGAINLPVLSDAERAEVGTIYVQQDSFLARKIGAAMVSRNAAAHLEGSLADRDGRWRPLVYCWRGGQRSGSFASILSQIGWRVELIDGGYKSYRRLVVAALYDAPISLNITLLDGGTGTAKTALLQELAAQGAQVLDLEGLAEHRGSVLGGFASGQPSQKMFESRLAGFIARLDPERPTYVEAESTKIGNLLIPPSLWAAMIEAPVLRLSAPLRERAAFTMRSYPDLTADPDELRARLQPLRAFHGAARLEAWERLIAEGRFEDLAASLIETHYDPRYTKSAQRRARSVTQMDVARLDQGSLAETAARIIAMDGK